jgi:hypothetical protein
MRQRQVGLVSERVNFHDHRFGRANLDPGHLQAIPLSGDPEGGEGML